MPLLKLKNGKELDINTIIFDFGGVLLDIDVLKTVNEFEKMGIKGLETKNIHPYNSGPFLELELGNISTEEFLDYFVNMDSTGRVTRKQVLDAWNILLLEYDLRRFELVDKLH